MKNYASFDTKFVSIDAVLKAVGLTKTDGDGRVTIMPFLKGIAFFLNFCLFFAFFLKCLFFAFFSEKLSYNYEKRNFQKYVANSGGQLTFLVKKNYHIVEFHGSNLPNRI